MNTDRLTVRVSTDVNATRRSLLKFDTETTIPAGARISSAKLTLYVRRGAGTTTRRIGVYPVTKSFQESQATWLTRKSGYSWLTAGGEYGTKIGELSVPATPGAPVTLDVTAAVQREIDSTSRYTRLGLIDRSAADSTSYREFHSSEAADPALRPKLVVVYGAASTTPAPAPATSTTSSTRSTLKVLDWNVHYSGLGTDGRFNPDRIVNWIVKLNPDVISLNEVTRNGYYDRTRDFSVYFTQQLKLKTGKTWYSYFRTDSGAASGVGNMVLSRFPIASTSHCQLSARRVAVKAAVYVNGRLLNVWSTHLDSSGSSNSMRIAEVKALQACMANYAEQKIVAGDFNAKASTSEMSLMATRFYDSWAKAAAGSIASSYPGNTSFGATRNARIDYIWYSRGATALVLKRAQVFDTRDANGYMPSDHKPLMVTFEVR